MQTVGVPPDDQQHLLGQLIPGERLLWAGKPDPRRIFSGEDIFLVPFSLMWCGFAVFWELSVLGIGPAATEGEEAPLFFAAWGAPFVLVGLYLVFGRFIVKGWARTRTVYAVTDQRVLVVRRLWRTRVTARYISSLHDVTASIRSDGSGSIQFSGGNSIVERFTASGGPWTSGLSGLDFIDVPDAAAAHAAITSVQQQNARTRG